MNVFAKNPLDNFDPNLGIQVRVSKSVRWRDLAIPPSGELPGMLFVARSKFMASVGISLFECRRKLLDLGGVQPIEATCIVSKQKDLPTMFVPDFDFPVPPFHILQPKNSADVALEMPVPVVTVANPYYTDWRSEQISHSFDVAYQRHVHKDFDDLIIEGALLA